MKRPAPISTSILYTCLALALGVVILMNSSTLSGFSITPSITTISSAGTLTEASASPSPHPMNIIMIVFDDWGVDGLDTPGLAFGSDLPHTPTLNSLAAQGVVFPETWVTTVCCSTRAEFMTGRFAYQTGIGKIFNSNDPSEYQIPLSEIFLPEMLRTGTGNRYQTVAIGKWHLAHDPNNPNLQGFQHYSGSIWNLGDVGAPIPGVSAYYNYPKTVNGVTTTSSTYATTEQVNDAQSWLSTNSNRPFFMYFALNAPHTPFHVPPAGLHYQGNLPSCTGNNKRKCWKAMIEAADTEIGRLLNSIPAEVRARTMVFVVGDNGTADGMILPPHTSTRGKGAIYEEGIRVPLIVSGPLVTQPGSVSNALVKSTDFFATFAEIARVNLRSRTVIPVSTKLNSISFVNSIKNPSAPSKRVYNLTEHFNPNGLNEGYPKPAPPVPYYQDELLQYQGPGTPHLQIVGDYLDLGNSADLVLSNAPPNSAVQIYQSTEDFNPTPMFGGTIVTVPASDIITAQTDASGNLVIPDFIVVNVEEFHQPRLFYYQAAIADSTQPGLYQISNAVEVKYSEYRNLKAIRNQCYKLHVSMNGNPQYEELYNLCTDRLEQNNLLENGPLTPGSVEHTNYTDLRNQLDAYLT